MLHRAHSITHPDENLPCPKQSSMPLASVTMKNENRVVMLERSEASGSSLTVNDIV
jgi:hypothetical protein